MKLAITCTLLLVGGLPIAAEAATEADDAFLTDYSRLKPAEDNPFEEAFVADNVKERASRYDSVLVEQPEIFIHPDSPYKGIRADDMKLIADSLRQRLINELRTGYRIVDRPGPSVLLIRVAIGDLVLQKQPAATPARSVPKAQTRPTQILVHDLARKIDVGDFKVEGEFLDSESSEQLAAFTASRGSLAVMSSSDQSWKSLNLLLVTLGQRVRCRLDNARAPPADWRRCGSIGLSARLGGAP
jgi:hypothetical protein